VAGTGPEPREVDRVQLSGRCRGGPVGMVKSRVRELVNAVGASPGMPGADYSDCVELR
jgi:hypothetical protein